MLVAALPAPYRRLVLASGRAIGEFPQQHIRGDADVGFESSCRIALVAAQDRLHQEAMLGYDYLAREAVAAQQQAIAGGLQVKLIAEPFQLDQRAGSDQRPMEPLVARLELVHIGLLRAALAHEHALQQVETRDDLVLPAGVAMRDRELDRLDLDQLARAGDVDEMRGTQGRNAEALLARLVHEALRGKLSERLAHGTRADAVALLEDANLELAVRLERAGDDVAPEQSERRLGRGRIDLVRDLDERTVRLHP